MHVYIYNIYIYVLFIYLYTMCIDVYACIYVYVYVVWKHRDMRNVRILYYVREVVKWFTCVPCTCNA